MTNPTIGATAPHFALCDAAGNTVTLESLLGHPFVLYFYPKDDTPGCTAEACEFTSSLGDFAALGTRVIGISPDSPESHALFIRKHGLRLTLLSDPEHVAAQAYGAWGLKRKDDREYEGILRSTVLVDAKGIILHRWTNVDPFGHAQAVRQTIAELLGH